MNRQKYIYEIYNVLAFLRNELELANSINLYDLNILSENTYRDLFNLTYDLGLGNLNKQTTNAEYIDLIDEKNKLAIQVTSRNDSTKIKEAIEGFFKNPENKDFELKVLLIAKQAKNYRTDFTFDGKYKFDAEKDVIDIEKLLKDIDDKPTAKLKDIAELLSSEVTIPEQKQYPTDISSPKGFIGREDELNLLREAKANGKTSFVLHGQGGVGKTDLALEFIKENKAFWGRSKQVNMFGLSENPTSWADAMMEVIRIFEPGVSPDLSESEIKELYNALLTEHKPILFFDNAIDRDQVEPLNNASAFILITSRNTFNVSGGFSYEVNEMSINDARELLYSIVDKERFDGEADNLAHLAGYLPMALLPLASLLVEDITLETSDLIQKYADRKERLQLADPNRENLSVKASFDLSYETLTDELKERWRKLAVFPADFDLEAMETVCLLEDGKEVRSELIKKHLLEFDKETKRSKLHDLARDYTNELLSDEERLTSEYFHCFHFGKLLASLDTVTLPNLEKFEIEQNNIEHGFAWLVDKVEINEDYAQICGYYVDNSYDILILRLHYREYIKWLETGLRASRRLDNVLQIVGNLSNLGAVYSHLGEYRKAIGYIEEALTIADEIGSQEGKGTALSNLGATYSALGEYRKAIVYYEQALTIAKEIEYRKGECTRLNNLGVAYFNLGEYQKAIDYHEKSLVIAKDIGDKGTEGKNLGSLGNSYLFLGKYQKAVDYNEQYLAIATDIGDRKGEGNSLSNLGVAYGNLGEYLKAIYYHNKSLVITREIGDRNSEACDLGNLGVVYASLEEHQKAIDYYEQAMVITKEIGDRQGEGNHLGNLGIAHANLGNRDKAKDYFEQATAILEAIESPNAEVFRQNLAILENEG